MDETDLPRSGDGAVSRFFVGSNPIVRRLLARARRDGGSDVEIAFSERVRIEAGVPFEVEANGTITACRVGNGGELSSDFGASLLWLLCADVHAGDALVIRATMPIYARRSGAEVRDASGIALGTVGASVGEVAAAFPDPLDEAEAAVARRTAPMPASSVFVPRFGLDRAI